MAKLKLPSFDGGTLLQRTLLYMVTFVLGSAGFVAIASLLVVWAAKSMIPARNTESSATAADKMAEVGAATPGKSAAKRGRPSKVKSPVDGETPPEEETP
jgi:hypothetical protein